MRKYAALLAAALLAACASFTPLETGSGFLFALSPVNLVHPGPQKEALIVMTPTAAPELDTQRIALLRAGRKWDYYAGARWSSFLPLVVRDSLARSLENAHIFKTVATDETGIEGDKLLKTEIRDFEAVYEKGGAPTIKIALRFSLVTRQDRRPLVSLDVAAAQKAASPRLTDIQSAFAAAFSAAQRQAVEKIGTTSSR